MAMPITMAKVVETLAAKTGITKKDVSNLIAGLTALAYKEAKNSFTIPGIGKLVLVSRIARVGRNPQTGAAIKIPAKKVVKLYVAKGCKEAILEKGRFQSMYSL